jgi:hypothetical protein
MFYLRIDGCMFRGFRAYRQGGKSTYIGKYNAHEAHTSDRANRSCLLDPVIPALCEVEHPAFSDEGLHKEEHVECEWDQKGR